MNINDLFVLKPEIINALEVLCEDLEFERDVYQDYLVNSLTGKAKVQIIKAKIKEQK